MRKETLSLKHPPVRQPKGTPGPKQAASGGLTPLHPIQHSQQTLGNQPLLRLIQSGKLRPKLAISQPSDPSEREADRIADQAMRSAEAAVQRKCAPCAAGGPFCSTCEEGPSHRSARGAAATEASLLPFGPGRPLDPATRTFMEAGFGADFSRVRIHTGSDAAASARSVDALAFTLGRDVVFDEGEYAPETAEGRRLIAHELAHTVQQGPAAAPTISRQAAAAHCTPAPGFTPSHCSAYAAAAWWLPLAYVNNATCACVATPDSPTANCVRKFLQDRLAAAPTWLKTMAAAQKPLELNPITHPSYQAFVQTTLTPRIYQDHVDAYRNCCCPSGPADYWSWIGVTTVPIQPCSAVGDAIRYFGSCHGTPGTW